MPVVGQNLGILSQANPDSVFKMRYVTSTIVNAEQITAPTDLRYNDLVVLIEQSNGSVFDVNDTAIPEFTNIINETGGDSHRAKLSYLLATGTEAGQTFTGLHNISGLEDDKFMMVFRPNFKILGINQSFQSQGTNATPTTQNVSISTLRTALVAFGIFGADNAVSGRSMSITEDGEVVSVNTKLYAKYRCFSTFPPLNYSVSMSDSGNDNWLASGYFQILY